MTDQEKIQRIENYCKALIDISKRDMASEAYNAKDWLSGRIMLAEDILEFVEKGSVTVQHIRSSL